MNIVCLWKVEEGTQWAKPPKKQSEKYTPTRCLFADFAYWVWISYSMISFAYSFIDLYIIR